MNSTTGTDNRSRLLNRGNYIGGDVKHVEQKARYRWRPHWDYLNDPPLTEFKEGSSEPDRSNDADVLYREQVAEINRQRAIATAAENQEVSEPLLNQAEIEQAFTRVDSAQTDAVTAFNFLLSSAKTPTASPLIL